MKVLSIDYDYFQKVSIESIKKHPKYNAKKHGSYVSEIEAMSKPDMKLILELNGKKRDGWKSIIKDIRNGQLSLF